MGQGTRTNGGVRETIAWMPFLIAAALAGCGGGDQKDPSQASSGGPGARASAQAATVGALTGFFPPGATVPADAHLKGMFSPVYNWPLIPLHAVLMPDGRVMTYGTRENGQQTAYFIYDLWDGTGAPDQRHGTLANTTASDLFCSSQLLLPGLGNVFVAGGDNWTGTGTTNTGNNNSSVLNAGTGLLARGPNMQRARWYSTSTTLINGETYIQGGSSGEDRPEIRSRDGAFRLLTSVNTSTLDYMYPRNFVVGDGRVFGFDSAGKMYYVNAAAGTYTGAGQFNGAYAGSDASAAMFRPGRILQFGGNSNGALVIDVSSGGTPVVTPTQSMATQRRLATATLLADGKVLASGGSPVYNDAANSELRAEIWDPATGRWTVGAAGALPRLYHSIGMLLPDGSVMVGGGGAPGPYNNTNTEIYYPPYLFKAGGQRALRPSIDSGPAETQIGRNFTLAVSGATSVSRVVMVKTGSVTHGWNMEQRFLDLTFSASGTSLTVQAPAKAGDATPGYYMIFAFDQAGVPSVAHITSLGIAANPNPGVVPSLVNPGNRSALVGASQQLSLSASDPNGDALSYTATGLPPGLSLNASTGLISGAPSLVGSYNVAASVSDGIHLASVNFVWTVSVPGQLALDPLASPTVAMNNTSAVFNASATGGNNPRFQWNFGDGTAETAWSASGSASHTYTRAGTYVVTVTVADDNGSLQSRSFLQTVYLPATARKPTASTALLIETPASGNPRLWVVNPDNDSVTAFDAVTQTRLGELAVGIAPRTLAVAPNGLLWVVNKQSATISVINPATRTISRTISLPRASQPYGIAMSPTTAHAYVALEATGQLLKIDTGSYATVSTLAVGANPRHVSVTADGNSVHVSRFITPMLPGEATASISAGAGNGGQVVVVNAGAMSVNRSIVLQMSTVPDAENQGRGLPNYLGAAVISPDGSQAFVPSKQDNVQRGALRDGTGLNFQNTVRAVSSRIDLGTGQEDLASRVDHDNASMASAAAFDAHGVLLFVALETSREVAIVDAHRRTQLMRLDTGRAPQGVALSADGRTLFVHNFMDRSVGVYDLSPLVRDGVLNAPLLATLPTVGTDKLSAQVLQGKQLFYDARDTRLARDRYMSCASCHNDGGQDGRVWDMTGFGEGLRNTISLRGRAGAQGRLHWSNNFDEVQDFEGQIRSLAGGSGLMSDTAFLAGTRRLPLGDAKAGVSSDLDALAAYVSSLSSFDPSPYRTSTGALSTAGAAGKSVFQSRNCASCHAGSAFTGSGLDTLISIGSLKASSGQRLGAPLAGIDVPTLRDVWATAPYLHDGSAATLDAAVRAHSGTTLGTTDLNNLVAYLREIGGEEASAPQSAGSGTGLTGRYYRGMTATGTVRLTRTESVDFNWGTGRPTTNVSSDGFSARWTGFVVAPATGSYRFQTVSDDGVRLTVNNQLLVNNWSSHSPTTDTSSSVNLLAGQRVPVTLEYFENTSGAEMRLRWLTPGGNAFVAIPRDRLAPN